MTYGMGSIRSPKEYAALHLSTMERVEHRWPWNGRHKDWACAPGAGVSFSGTGDSSVMNEKADLQQRSCTNGSTGDVRTKSYGRVCRVKEVGRRTDGIVMWLSDLATMSKVGPAQRETNGRRDRTSRRDLKDATHCSQGQYPRRLPPLTFSGACEAFCVKRKWQG